MEARAANRSSTDEFRDKAAQLGQDIRDLGSAAKDMASETVGSYYKEGREKVVQLERSVENRIREHPLQSVLIATGVGFLAGFLISRRR